MSVAFLDLKERLTSWFHRKDREINTGGKDIDTGGGDVIVGAGTVDGVDLTVHVADTDAHHNQQHAIDGADHTGQLDHGADLTGLADDDHTQYHNNTRGDARYYQTSEFNSSPGATSQPLKTDSSGFLQVTGLGANVSPTTDDILAAADILAGGGITVGDTSTNPDNATIFLKEVGTPGTPPSGYGVLFMHTTGRLYYKNDAGTLYGPL